MFGYDLTTLVTIISKIGPLYLVILLGYLAGTRLNARKETVASLLIYTIAPIVILQGTATARLTPGLLLLPVLFFGTCCGLAVAFYALGCRVWSDSRKNILAFAAGTGNTGYFGMPVAVALFDTDAMGIVVLSILGFVLYENTLGFYLTAKGRYTPRESLSKVLRLPAVYAFLAGLGLNLSGISMGPSYAALAESFRGAYTILGMMIIGLGMAGMRRVEVDKTFIGLTFLAKFVAWPAMVALLVSIDVHGAHLFDVRTHKIMILLSTVPVAANTVAVATELGTEPEKSASVVLLSTVLALFYIPVAAARLLA